MEEKAIEYGLTLMELEELLEADPRRAKFIEAHKKGLGLDALGKKVIDELMAEKGIKKSINPVEKTKPMKTKEEHSQNNKEEKTKESKEPQSNNKKVEKPEEKTKEIKEEKKTRTRKPKVKSEAMTISDIIAEVEESTVGPATLRKFALENLGIKAEKLCLMSDSEVNETVLKKYVVIPYQDKILFIKNNASVIVM